MKHSPPASVDPATMERPSVGTFSRIGVNDINSEPVNAVPPLEEGPRGIGGHETPPFENIHAWIEDAFVVIGAGSIAMGVLYNFLDHALAPHPQMESSWNTYSNLGIIREFYDDERNGYIYVIISLISFLPFLMLLMSRTLSTKLASWIGAGSVKSRTVRRTFFVSLLLGVTFGVLAQNFLTFPGWSGAVYDFLRFTQMACYGIMIGFLIISSVSTWRIISGSH